MGRDGFEVRWLYPRQPSRRREGEGYISPEVQRDSITAYASELGGTITAWHDDQDFSGGNTEHPGFHSMLDRLESGETDGIMVMSIDRFARSTADGSKVTARWSTSSRTSR